MEYFALSTSTSTVLVLLGSTWQRLHAQMGTFICHIWSSLCLIHDTQTTKLGSTCIVHGIYTEALLGSLTCFSILTACLIQDKKITTSQSQTPFQT